jgi:hypothetical protein
MFIANITWGRSVNPGDTAHPFRKHEYQKLGSLWYDEDGEQPCSVKLLGFRFGLFFAKPFDSIAEPPYIKGDMFVPSTDDDDCLSGGLRVGFIYTESNQDGCIYQGVLDVDPWPCLIGRWIASGHAPSALFLNVKLEDR